jgi:hypothetical protein
MLCLRKAEISTFLECIHGIVKSIFFMPCDLLFGVGLLLRLDLYESVHDTGDSHTMLVPSV